ncbi:MAG: hypothetical protein HZC37_31760 [Burkholderiales bacterium]|nr:hypothetical protein [Burkholderiales bacterium]
MGIGIVAPAALAAPGAHGPNGEHLDGPAAAGARAALPRVEAKSETFELVAELKGGELVVLVDRYESNEPVLGARLEVESGALKAVAAFRAEQGDYLVKDPALLKALAAAGEHALVFTLAAGNDSDLLDGTLVIARAVPGGDPGHSHGAGGDHGHSHALQRAAWIGGALLVLSLLSGLWWWRQWRKGHPSRQSRLGAVTSTEGL